MVDDGVSRLFGVLRAEEKKRGFCEASSIPQSCPNLPELMLIVSCWGSTVSAAGNATPV